MRPDLEAIARAQGGIFLRRHALVSGYSKREFDRMTSRRGGLWHRVRYGVYTSREAWDGLEDRERWILRDRAALLVCDPGTVLSHSSAARWHGFDLYDVNDKLTHVTRLRAHGRRVNRIESGIKHHCGLLEASGIELIEGQGFR